MKFIPDVEQYSGFNTAYLRDNIHHQCRLFNVFYNHKARKGGTENTK